MAGRPPLPIGSYGKIKTVELGHKKFRSRARFRSQSGRLILVERTGTSTTAAENALKKAMVDLVAGTNTAINSMTKFPLVAEKWHEDITLQVEAGEMSTTTARNYRGYLDNHVLPAMQDVRMHEVTVTRVDEFFKIKRKEGMKPDALRSLRAVMAGVCGYAVRHEALGVNPVRDIAKISGSRKTVRALTAEERADLLTQLQALPETRSVDSQGRALGPRARIWHDLPDLVQAMLSTGVRIGELLAITGEEVDLNARTVTVDWHIVRVTGQGLVRTPLRKGGGQGLLLSVPDWSVSMWRKRKLASGGGPLFPAWHGGWMDPSNAGSRLREAFDACGFGWVTSHVFRKTVATVLDAAGVPTTAIADQLGNTPAVVERHYRAKRRGNLAAGEALEGMASLTGE